MRAWQYSSTKGGLEKNLEINPSALLLKLKPDRHLVRIIAAALNPIDYKPAEIPGIARFAITQPATPAPGSTIKVGQLVLGLSSSSPLAGGALSEFSVSRTNSTVALPDSVDRVDAATVGVAGLTAYQSIVPRAKKGDKIFINGGSGETGVFGIQFAKVMGCHVTTTCSTTNVELCKSLGAENVVDYKKEDAIEALKASGHKLDHAVDNVGTNKELLWHYHEFMKSGAIYVMVGGELSLGSLADNLKRKVWPDFLGGMKDKVVGFSPRPKAEDLRQIGEWMSTGKVKPVIDQKFVFEQAPQAFEKLKTGRAKGKIVINVASETYKKATV